MQNKGGLLKGRTSVRSTAILLDENKDKATDRTQDRPIVNVTNEICIDAGGHSERDLAADYFEEKVERYKWRERYEIKLEMGNFAIHGGGCSCTEPDKESIPDDTVNRKESLLFHSFIRLCELDFSFSQLCGTLLGSEYLKRCGGPKVATTIIRSPCKYGVVNCVCIFGMQFRKNISVHSHGN